MPRHPYHFNSILLLWLSIWHRFEINLNWPQNCIQRHVFDSRAVKDDDGGKLLNEDDDPRTVSPCLAYKTW